MWRRLFYYSPSPPQTKPSLWVSSRKQCCCLMSPRISEVLLFLIVIFCGSCSPADSAKRAGVVVRGETADPQFKRPGGSGSKGAWEKLCPVNYIFLT